MSASINSNNRSTTKHQEEISHINLSESINLQNDEDNNNKLFIGGIPPDTNECNNSYF